jgi:hypothetical protein
MLVMLSIRSRSRCSCTLYEMACMSILPTNSYTVRGTLSSTLVWAKKLNRLIQILCSSLVQAPCSILQSPAASQSRGSPSHWCFRLSLQLTLRNRLNAISHRRPVPSLNGTAAPSMGFGSSPAAEPSDPSLSKRNLKYRAFSEPVQPPPVIRASDRPDVVGVLGGISPQATANFMRQVIQATPATANKDHVPLIVSSIPQIPSLSAPILNRPAGPGSDEAVVSPLPALLQTRRFLEQSGARCIVMPSNMAHFWCKLNLFLRTT